MKWKYILIGIIVSGGFVLAVSYSSYVIKKQGRDYGVSLVSNNFLKEKIKLEFLIYYNVPQSNDSIFIENTIGKNLDESTSPSQEDWASGIFRDKGGVIPKDQQVFKIDPEYLKGFILNKLNDKYTLAVSNKTFTMITEGFYYIVDEGCGDDIIGIKLIPEASINKIDLTKEGFVVLRQPHAKIEKVEIISFIESKISENLENILMKILKERFTQFLKTNEYFAEGIKTSEIAFSEQPEVSLYKPKNGTNYTNYQFISAVWHIDQGEVDCCVSGIFHVKEDNGILKLYEVIPLNSNTKEVGDIGIKKVVRLNNRIFAFIKKVYWEWENEEIYEIIPNRDLWKSYSASRGTGGC